MIAHICKVTQKNVSQSIPWADFPGNWTGIQFIQQGCVYLRQKVPFKGGVDKKGVFPIL